MASVSTETMEQRPENKYSPAEVALARRLAKMKIGLDILPKETYPNGVPKVIYDDLEIPIKKMDGITVDAKFHMATAEEVKDKVLIVITHNNNIVSENLFHRWYPFTKETAQEDTMTLLEVIKGLTLDKSKTKFKTNCSCKDCEKEEEMIPELWCGLFEDCEKIQMKWDTCCVCHEITNSKFKDCGHTICLACCEKLKEKDNDDAMIIKCPICREEYYGGDQRFDDEILETF